MALEIGQIIKKLRKERNLTQEELAEQLNVTAQAVSKWENGTGMPDISQIVPLASVFGVGTDVLFGTFGTNDDEEVQKIIEAVNEPRRGENYKDEAEALAADRRDYDTLLAALQRYPSNTRMLRECLGVGADLAMSYRRAGDGRAAAVFTESVREAQLIINYSKDAAAVMEAHMWLVRLYSAFGEASLAAEHADAFPSGLGFNRGAMLARIMRGAGDTDGELRQRCDNINALLLELELEIRPLGDAYRVKGQYEDAIRVYKSIFGIIKAVYGDEEYTPPLHSPAWLHANLAGCCIKLGDIDGAIFWLNAGIDFRLRQAKHYNKRRQVETPLLRECVFEFFGSEYRAKKMILEDLSLPCFGSIRGDARFGALLDRVNALED